MKVKNISPIPFHEISYNSSGKGRSVLKLPFYKVTVDKLPDGVSSFVLTSDLQGREFDKNSNRLLGEVVAEELALLCELGELPPINFVALAGDFYDYPDLRKLGGTGDVTSVWSAFANLFPSVVGVLGNHDIIRLEELADNAFVLDGTTVQCAGINIGGVSGVIGSRTKNQRKSQDGFMKELQKVARYKNDLILLHLGPKGSLSEQKGDPTISEFFKSNGQGIVAFGHYHWQNPFATLGKSHLLNLDKRVFVVTEGD